MRGLLETVPIGDTFCSGLGAIERLDGNMFRFWLYALETPEDGGAPQKVVVARLIAPASAVPDAIMQMVTAIADTSVRVIPLVADLLLN